MRIYLVRHAQTAWNVEGRAQGSTDIDLDATGNLQSERLARHFQGKGIDAIYSSDMKRCLQTAGAIAEHHKLEIKSKSELRERRLGDWEGLLFSDLKGHFLSARTQEDQYGIYFRPPNGESIADTAVRLKIVAEEILESKQDTLVISHGGAISVLLSQFLQADLNSARRFKFANASVTELVQNDWNLFALETYNCTAHLVDSMVIQGNLDGSTR